MSKPPNDHPLTTRGAASSSPKVSILLAPDAPGQGDGLLPAGGSSSSKTTPRQPLTPSILISKNSLGSGDDDDDDNDDDNGSVNELSPFNRAQSTSATSLLLQKAPKHLRSEQLDTAHCYYAASTCLPPHLHHTLVVPRSSKSDPPPRKDDDEKDMDSKDPEDGLLKGQDTWTSLENRLLDIITRTIDKELKKYLHDESINCISSHDYGDTMSTSPSCNLDVPCSTSTSNSILTAANNMDSAAPTPAQHPHSHPHDKEWLSPQRAASTASTASTAAHTTTAQQQQQQQQHSQLYKDMQKALDAYQSGMAALEARVATMEQAQQQQQQQQMRVNNNDEKYDELHARYLSLMAQHNDQTEKYKQLQQLHEQQARELHFLQQHQNQHQQHPMHGPHPTSKKKKELIPSAGPNNNNNISKRALSMHHRHPHHHHQQQQQPLPTPDTSPVTNQSKSPSSANLHHHHHQHHLHHRAASPTTTTALPPSPPNTINSNSPGAAITSFAPNTRTRQNASSSPPIKVNQQQGYVEFLTRYQDRPVRCQIKLPIDPSHQHQAQNGPPPAPRRKHHYPKNNNRPLNPCAPAWPGSS